MSAPREYNAKATAALCKVAKQFTPELDATHRFTPRGAVSPREPLCLRAIELLEGGADPNAAPELLYEMVEHSSTPVGGDNGYENRLDPLSYRVMELALQKGADCTDSANEHPYPLLHRASGAGHPRIIELLIRYGAPLDLQDGAGNTALSVAHNAENILTLLKAGARLDVRNYHGKAPFQQWNPGAHEDLLQPKCIRHHLRELLRIDDWWRNDTQLMHDPDLRMKAGINTHFFPLTPSEAPVLAALQLWWQFDGARFAREAEPPRDTVVARYVRGAVAQKERS